MTANVGTIDRIVRLVAGLVLVAMPFATSLPVFESGLVKYGFMLVGLVLASTAAMRFCPLYRLLGIKTCNV